MDDLLEFTNTIPFEERFKYIDDAVSLCTMAEMAFTEYKDKDLSQSIYCRSINNSSSSYDLSLIGKSIKSVIGDFSWASSVFLLAERKAKTAFDYWFLASMYNYYPDKAYQLLDNSGAIAKTPKEFAEISYVYLTHFNDMEKCKIMLEKAVNSISNIDDYITTALNYYKLLADVPKTKELIKIAFRKSETFADKAKIINFCIINKIKTEEFETLLNAAYHSAMERDDFGEIIKILAQNYPDRLRIKETLSDSFLVLNTGEFSSKKHVTIEFINRPWADELLKKVAGLYQFTPLDSSIYKIFAKSIGRFVINPAELMFTYRLYLKG